MVTSYSKALFWLKYPALFLRSDPLSTLICHENGAFRKCSSNRGNLKIPTLRSRADKNVLKTDNLAPRPVKRPWERGWKTELFDNDCVTIITWFPCSSFSQTQIQNGRWLLQFQIPPTSCEQRLSNISGAETDSLWIFTLNAGSSPFDECIRWVFTDNLWTLDTVICFFNQAYSLFNAF